MGIRALIVDDSATMRSVIRKILGVTGIEMSGCFEAANGKEALETLRREWVDVIVTDLHMPVMDGLQLLRQLKQDDLMCRVPVIIVTTEAREDMVKKALALGANAHVKKPFHPETIREALQEILGEEYAKRTSEGLGGCDF